MKNYSQYFKYANRVNGELYYYVDLDAPDELKHFIRKVHLDCFYECLPNDWVYQEILGALRALEDEDTTYVPPEPSVYDHDLAKWFLANCNQFANQISKEMVEEFGCEFGCVTELIATSQSEALGRIYRSVEIFLKEDEE